MKRNGITSQISLDEKGRLVINHEDTIDEGTVHKDVLHKKTAFLPNLKCDCMV